MKDPNPEFSLLIHCLRQGTESPSNGKLDFEQIDWQYWLKLLGKHGVLVQVYHKILKEKIHHIPQPVVDQLKQFYYTNITRSTRLFQELVTIVKTMAEIGITVIPFKGPVLSAQIYGDYTIRTFTDLDILIKSEDFIPFYKKMTDLGYRPDLTLPQKSLQQWARWGREYIFQKDKNLVDVHFRIQRGPKFRDSEDTLMESCSEVEFMNQKVKTLSEEYAILALCINGSKDGWNKMNSIVDLSTLILDQPNLDWNSLIARAKKMKVLAMLRVGLYLMEATLGQIHKKPSTHLRKKDILHVSQKYRKNLATNGKYLKKIALQFLKLRSLDTIWSKLRYIAYYLIVPKVEDLKLPVTVRTLFIATILRPLFLIARLFK